MSIISCFDVAIVFRANTFEGQYKTKGIDVKAQNISDWEDIYRLVESWQEWVKISKTEKW